MAFLSCQLPPPTAANHALRHRSAVRKPCLAGRVCAAQSARLGIFLHAEGVFYSSQAATNWRVRENDPCAYDCASMSPDFANGAVTGAFSYAAGASYANDNEQASLSSPYANSSNCAGCYDVAGNGSVPGGFSSNPGPSFDPLLQAATDAYNSNRASILADIPPLSWLRGIFVHSAFAANVNALGPEYSAEVSYKNGLLVPYGTPGSVRADAIYGQPRFTCICCRA
jgi:hypothetical protein